jgi:UDP-3-O-[3-hydroxymyristoyl] glucosamine N-acyltransferase
VVAIGNPALRRRWQQVLKASGAPLGVVVHPRAYVSPSAQLAPGCVVLAGAVVNADAQLERGVLVNSGAVVDHDALCGPYSQLGVNAAMAGGSRLGPLASLAAGEVLGCGESRFAELEWTPSAPDPI